MKRELTALFFKVSSALCFPSRDMNNGEGTGGVIIVFIARNRRRID